MCRLWSIQNKKKKKKINNTKSLATLKALVIEMSCYFFKRWFINKLICFQPWPDLATINITSKKIHESSEFGNVQSRAQFTTTISRNECWMTASNLKIKTNANFPYTVILGRRILDEFDQAKIKMTTCLHQFGIFNEFSSAFFSSIFLLPFEKCVKHCVQWEYNVPWMLTQAQNIIRMNISIGWKKN